MHMLRNLAMAAILAFAPSLWADAPAGYYDACKGKSGASLLTALCHVVGPHTNVGYDGLWSVYQTSDMRPDGTLWDIYSTKHWPSNYTKCGNYKLVGDCVNREHSFPKSWFGGKTAPMYSDAYHLYPTDGKVNGQRSNYAYGECSGGKSLAANGDVKPLGRLGTSTFPGFSGTVFEPDNEYKGDLARTYFYMITAYNDKVAGWTEGNAPDMLAGNSYPAFKTWAVNMLLQWSRQDPVSDKERTRNDAVASYQHNRNPYIDHPELAEYIWGDRKTQAWDPDNASMGSIITPSDGQKIDFGIVLVGTPAVKTVPMKITGTDAFTVSVSGISGLTSSPASGTAPFDGNLTLTLTAQGDNQGSLTGNLSGTVAITSGSSAVSCPVTATWMAGMGFLQPTVITETTATLPYAANTDRHIIVQLSKDGENAPGYPRQLTGSKVGEYTFTDLEPSTTYVACLTDAEMAEDSPEVTFTTATPQPSVGVLYDGDLHLQAVEGQPSEAAELLLDIDNITADITYAVKAPFALSSDKSQWGQTLTMTPQEDRFYLRLQPTTAGEYSTSLTITSGTYHNDDVDIDGTVIGDTPWCEDFEAVGKYDSYSDKTYVGTMCSWSTNAYLIPSGDMAYPHSGAQACRMPKSDLGKLTMLADKTGGVGTLSVWARRWKGDTSNSTFDVKVSKDQGKTWETVGSFTVNADAYTQYSVPVERTGNVRISLEQQPSSTGRRAMIDDVALSNYSAIDGVNALECHSWDAFWRDGRLVVEGDGVTLLHVYGLDGLEYWQGRHSAAVDLPAGLYIVASDTYARRVVVK